MTKRVCDGCGSSDKLLVIHMENTHDINYIENILHIDHHALTSIDLCESCFHKYGFYNAFKSLFNKESTN